MDTGILIALIAGIGGTLTGIGAILSAILMHRKTVALLEWRMQSVEKKLDSHNGYAEKFAQTSADIADMRKDIAVVLTTVGWIQKEVEEKK